MEDKNVMKRLAERLEIGPKLGKGVYISPAACVLGEVVAGNDVSIWPCCVLRADINSIVIGDRTNIQDGSVIHVSQKFNTTIGKNSTIGHAVNLHGCVIGNNVLVGIGAIILDEVVIGDNCIIAAGSLVPPRKIIPANSMVIGSPAKVVRELTPEDIDWIKRHTDHYIDYKNMFLEKGF